MTRIANAEGRVYRSDLRAQQAEDTRSRILEAAIRVTADGIAFVSIPAVAREAGVSVPTVYRHFRSKRGLLAAIYPYALQRAGLNEVAAPRSVDGLRNSIRGYFEMTDSLGDLTRAAMASPASDDVRRLTMPKRVAMFREVADSIVPRPSARDRDRIARLLVILTSSAALRLWRDQLGSSVDEAAGDADWMIQAIVAMATSRSEP